MSKPSYRFTDRRGVDYSATQLGTPRFDKKGNRTDGFTVVRLSRRPVEIKRMLRAKKKAAKSINALAA